MKDELIDKQEFATKELESIEPKEEEDKLFCDKCNDTGIIEIMGGSDADEWGVVDEKECDCGMLPYKRIITND